MASRQRAERREQEALLLHRLGTGLLSGQRVDDVLERFAGAVVDLLGLARCEITTNMTRVVVAEDAVPSEHAADVAVPMMSKDEEVGRITVLPKAGSRVGQDQLEVIGTFAAQVALALGGMTLASEAQGARIEAETNKLRATLLSSVTHDLRTPLASITASVTSLLDDKVDFSPSDHRDLLETTRQEAERLNRLVGNLLELSRLRAGSVVVTKAPAMIDEVIEGVVGRLHRRLQDHDVRVMLGDDLPETMIDVVQIDQLVTNLVENATKFSPRGSQITLSARPWRNCVRVRVADQGCGVAAEERERVFEPFVRLDTLRSGSGLGLSIARAIVEAHGGRIWLEGAPGGGTAVTFDLPVSA
jgi:two-component system sensor histidine kinase KdpD